MCPAGNRFISSSDQGADEFRLADRPPGQRGPGTSGKAADRKQNEREGNGQKSPDNGGGKHAGTKGWVARGDEETPVEAGGDENEGEQRRDRMPNDPRALEAADQVAGHQYAYDAEVLEFWRTRRDDGSLFNVSWGRNFFGFIPGNSIEQDACKAGTFVLGNSGEPKDTKFILARVKNQIQKVVKELQKSHPEFSLRTVSDSAIAGYAEELTEEQVELLHGTIKNRDITKRALRTLNEPSLDHKLIGALMNDHQSVLRDILKISTPKIDRMIGAALKAGALGAKINGSGGGGCMFAYAPENPEEVKLAIEKEGGVGYIVTTDEGTRASSAEIL